MKAWMMIVAAVAAARMTEPQAAPARWEYGRLTVTPLGRDAVAVWSAGDTTAVLPWTRQRDAVGSNLAPRTIPIALSYIQILNGLGAVGWEVISSVDEASEQVTLFKRPKP